MLKSLEKNIIKKGENNEKFEKILFTIIFVIALVMFLVLVCKFVYAYHLRDGDEMWVLFITICVVTCLYRYLLYNIMLYIKYMDK